MKKLFVLLAIAGIQYFEPVPCSAQYKDILNFSGVANGANPYYGSLVLSGNVLYGMTNAGGTHGDGCIFSIDTNGDRYKDLLDFNGTNGSEPYGSLILSDTVLYGMTSYGAANNEGCVFRIDTLGKGYKDILDFNGANGTNAEGTLRLLGNVLFGMTSSGGANVQYGLVFSVHTDGTHYHDILDFNGTNGSSPSGDLTILGTKLYGMATYGGANGDGTIFSIDTNGGGYKDLYDFNNTNGGYLPYGDLTQSGNKFFGMTYKGAGANIDGVIFSIDTNGSGYTDLLQFNGTNGKNPYGSFTISGNILYGMTNLGGAHSKGLIFSIDTNGSGYQDLVDFTNTNGSYPGANPEGNLTLSGGSLFGMTYAGGPNNDGVVFHEAVCYLLSASAGGTNVTCHGANNGSATVTASKGPAPYIYSWSGGGGTNATASGLSAGNYTVNVTDNNGCNATASVIISQPNTLTLSASTIANVSCHADSSGIASAATSGGTLPYAYSWTTSPVQISSSASKLSAGNYSVTVTDKNGCTATASTTITQPTAMNITPYSVSTNNANCNGIAAVTVTGGTPPYNYFWTVGYQQTDTITGQCPGTWCCHIHDNNGCPDRGSDSICVTIPLNSAGIDNISNSSSISIYPDPNNGKFTIQCVGTQNFVSNPWSVEVYNVLGERVYLQSAIHNSQCAIDLSSQADGVYLVKILNNTGGLVTEQKMVKMQ